MKQIMSHNLPDQHKPEKDRTVELRTAFIQNVEHELRTPLTIVYGYAELLTEGTFGPLTPKQEQAMETMQRRLHDLCIMVHRIGALLETEMYGPISAPLVLNDIVASVINERSEAARQARLELKLSLDAHLSLHGNPGHLRHALDCLLENAIKFTPAGGQIEVRGYTEPDWVCLTVTDTGIGIEEDQLPYLLSGFYQADHSTTRRYGGIGLGLTVVKTVVEAHAGQIEIASQPGCGSQFTIKLPRSSLDGQMKPAGEMRPNSRQSWRILIVDDEENVAHTLQSNLSRLPNCEVCVAYNGEQALRLLAQRPFHLVITDYKMPGMDGITLAARVRQLYPNTVIIMMTAYNSDELRGRAARVSIRRILDKPIEISTVRSVTLEALTMM